MDPSFLVFSLPDFDANEYANAILAGSASTESNPKTPAKSTFEPSPKEDISVAISKLNFGVEDVSKQIKSVVNGHHAELLAQAASANALAGSLTLVRSGLADLDPSLDKLRLKVRVPYQSLKTSVSRLQRLQQASDVLRRTSRFVVLARRLQNQMTEINSENSDPIPKKSESQINVLGDPEDEKERTIAKAALSIAELVALLDGPVPRPTNSEGSGSGIPLRSINAVAAHVPFIEDARTKVTTEMENMVLMGLTTLNQSLLASSLQTAFNLRVLPELVQSLISDLSQAVEDRIRSAFDLSKISRDASSKDPAPNSPSSPTSYKSRVRTEPTTLTAPQWTAALWNRLETMVDEMADCCVKVYTLEKVLKMKRDTVSQVVFLDEAMKLLENKPSATFWTALGKSLEKHTRDSARGSTFLQQTLSTGYPRLLRLFHRFFSKIAVHTDTVYAQTYQSPETVLVLRALSNFESLYVSRSSNKLNEAVGQAFSGGSRSPPGMNEGVNIARTVANELDSARFDPLLVRAVAKNVGNSLDMLLSRADGLEQISKDRPAVTLMGPSATPQQVSNGLIASCLYHCWSRLEKLGDEHAESVVAIIKPNVENIYQAYRRLVDPILVAIRRELSAIITKLHRINFNKPADAMSGISGPSFYMKDLVDKLSFIKVEILSKYSIGDAGREWVISIVKFVIRTFVLHVSIAKPLGESGKLQLTSDMTELEFALSAFLMESGPSKRSGSLETVGDDYRILRAMRPLLFLDNVQLTSPKHTAGLPPLIVLHHILVRSPVPLPHSLHGWQEAEYVRWVDEHSEEEAWTLVEGGLSHWEKIQESEGGTGSGAEYVELARTVLSSAQARVTSTMLALRARGVARPIFSRFLSSTTRLRAEDESPRPPQPPKPIDDSTSALDYKQTHRTRPPPLPAMDLPRSRSAEEAVTNILYNTPASESAAFLKSTSSIASFKTSPECSPAFLESLLAGGSTLTPWSGQDGVVEQARRQLEDLVPVWVVLDYTNTRTISRELLLVKVSILGPEYLEEQLQGGPSLEPRRAPAPSSKLEREAALVHNVEHSGEPTNGTQLPTLTPSEALRVKHQHLHSINVLASQFGAKIVDVSEHSVIVELTAKTARVEAFLNLVKPFGILEAARTGLMAMPRTPFAPSPDDEAPEAAESVAVDATLLPPG
ncbi:ACT domain-containing protein [Mycena sanguinolenta]|uniref:Conserved oligomeric Golgi complex subunit 5 n=1 Tax=Mycena sanguinolenta TaxID=230812 RepID=A0A8H6ZEL2_9AGAR|nr:ACT domain-containing protein [Mycena sanguinolenta]